MTPAISAEPMLDINTYAGNAQAALFHDLWVEAHRGDFVGCLEMARKTLWQVYEEGKMQDPQVALDWFTRWKKDGDA